MPVRALLLPFGSAGDVHPFVGLGAALQARGHEVTVATNEHFAPLVRRQGLGFLPLGDEAQFLEALNDPELWHPRRGFRAVTGKIVRLLRMSYDLVAEQARLGPLVVVTSILGFGPRIAHDRLGVPLATVHLQPGVLRSVHEPPIFPGIDLTGRLWPRWSRRLLFWLIDRAMIDRMLGPVINAFRAELGLPPVRRLLGGWMNSPQLVLGFFPEWFGRPQPDWPPQLQLTGFPLFDESTVREPDPALEGFLAAGGPPIVFTPGSAMKHAHAFFAEAAGALRRLDRRGLFLTRYPEQLPAELPDSLRHFDYVPFSRVLPRCAALVHHGGIGTTAQGLAAGIPQLIMPMAHDQPDNAARLRRLGVGMALPPRRFGAGAVAATLRRLVESPETSGRCRELSRRIRESDPTLDDACRAVERLSGEAASPRVSAAG